MLLISISNSNWFFFFFNVYLSLPLWLWTVLLNYVIEVAFHSLSFTEDSKLQKLNPKNAMKKRIVLYLGMYSGDLWWIWKRSQRYSHPRAENHPSWTESGRPYENKSFIYMHLHVLHLETYSCLSLSWG